MKGEEESSEPRSRKAEPAHEDNDKTAGARVLQDIGEVVAHHRVAPDPVLEPEGGVKNRVVLLRGTDLEPDAPKAPQGLEAGDRDMKVIVQEPTAGVGRVIRDERRREEKGGQQQVPSAIRRDRCVSGATPGLHVRKGKQTGPALQILLKWWQDPESNRGHKDFQSSALPAELSCRVKMSGEY